MTIKEEILSKVIDKKKQEQKAISYSQYVTYRECPFRWSLKYKEKYFPFDSNINSVFGTSMHQTIQEWLTLLFTSTVKSSEEYDFQENLSNYMIRAYEKELESNGGVHFIKKEEMEEYFEDGLNILYYLRKKRKVLFDYREWELVAIELPMFTPVLQDNDIILYNGFIDMLLISKDKKRFRIIDFKSSTRGWTDYQFKDQLKMDQVLLYKHFFSKQYGIPVEDIEGEFLILKRKVYEDAEYPIPRHRTYLPAQGPGKVKQAVANLEKFVVDVFYDDGSYQEKEYEKKPGSACKFCPFAGNRELCNQNVE